MSGQVPVEVAEYAQIDELIDLQCDLNYQASRLHELNQLFGDDFPLQLRPDHLRAWLRQAKLVLDTSLEDITQWKSRHGQALHLIQSCPIGASELKALSEPIETELVRLETYSQQLRQAVGL
jgi:hypothetical protein